MKKLLSKVLGAEPEATREDAVDDAGVAKRKDELDKASVPPSDGHCWMLSLPPSMLVLVLSFAACGSAPLRKFAELGPAFARDLGSDDIWRHLCRAVWYIDEERFKEWPQIRSWRTMYRTLEQWAVLEGFYTLPQAFPFGMLALVRFEKGKLLCEAVRFRHEPDPNSNTGEGRALREVFVPLFEIAFAEENDGVEATVSFSNGLGALASVGAKVEALPEALEPLAAQTLQRALRMGFQGSGTELLTRWLPRGRGFSVAVDGPELFEARAAAEEVPAEPSPWIPSEDDTARRSGDEEEDRARRTTFDLIRDVFCKQQRLAMMLVRSPSELDCRALGVPDLRPGLYVGNYSHSFYGQFRFETLLIEFRACRSTAEVEALFQRPVPGEGMPDSLRAGLEQVWRSGGEATFVVGQKVTGDFHVPAGQHTFIAVLGPPELRLPLDIGRERLPAHVPNRTTGGMEVVRTSWSGFGTLAMPGFGSPSWANGWLICLEPSEYGGTERYGFSWARNQDVVILEYVRTQTGTAFLSRKWLPVSAR